MISDKIKNYMNKFLNILFYSAVILIIGAGIYARLKLYLREFPFWYDEALLGQNFFIKNYHEFFLPFDSGVKIPPFFSILVKFFLEVFGYTVLNFRFIPQISAILSVIAFYFLLKQYFNNKGSVLFALTVFALNIKSIIYSCEFRPYSSDILLFILVLITYKYISFKSISNSKILIYTLFSIVLILFSFPLMFLIPATVITKSIEEKSFNPKVLWIFIGLLLTCLYLYLIDINLYKFMNNFWSDQAYNSFIKPTFSSFNIITNNVFEYQFNSLNILITINNSNYGQYLKYFCLAGLIILLFERKKQGLLFLFTLLFPIIASCLEIYPLSQRHTLYLMPVLILLICKTIDFQIFPSFRNNLHIKIISYIKSLTFCIILFYLMQLNLSYNYTFQNNILMFSFFPYTQNRYVYRDYSNYFLEKYKDEEPIYSTLDYSTYISFYNHLNSYNKKLNDIGLKYYGQYPSLSNFLNDYANKTPFWIIQNLSLNMDGVISYTDIDKTEQKLKSLNKKYKKYIDERKKGEYIIYVFE